MSTPKYVMFLNSLQTVLSNKDRDAIKRTIGDSINNNRSLTVNQVIRFLTRRGASSSQKRLGKQLANVYGILREDIQVRRSLFNSRNDALDINEFITTYTDLVVQGVTTTRRVVSRSLAA